MAGRMDVDETRAPLKDRQGGTTTMVPADSLFESNFQDFYKGCGVPKEECAASIARSIVEFAEELFIPLQVADCEHGTVTDTHWYSDLPVKDRIAKVFTPDGVESSSDLAFPADYVYTGRFAMVEEGLGGEEHVEDGSVYLKDLINVLREGAEEMAEVFVTTFKLKDSSSDGVARIYTAEVALCACSRAVKESIQSRREVTGVQLEGGMRKFYAALNEMLASDNRPRLQVLMPYIRGLNYFLNQTRHSGGTVYSGVCLNPNSCGRLRPGCRVRIPRFLSTTPLKRVAQDHVSDIGECKGVMLIITIPQSFWGARDITENSEFGEQEEETLFPAWSQYEVCSCDWKTTPAEVKLLAIDKYA